MAASGSWEFLSGLLVGAFLGFVLGPVFRFWLRWQEWTRASREAQLTESVLRRMEAGRWQPSR